MNEDDNLVSINDLMNESYTISVADNTSLNNSHIQMIYEAGRTNIGSEMGIEMYYPSNTSFDIPTHKLRDLLEVLTKIEERLSIIEELI